MFELEDFHFIDFRIVFEIAGKLKHAQDLWNFDKTYLTIRTITAQSKIQRIVQFKRMTIDCGCSKFFRAHETTAITIMNNIHRVNRAQRLAKPKRCQGIKSIWMNVMRETAICVWEWVSVYACALIIQFIVK